MTPSRALNYQFDGEIPFWRFALGVWRLAPSDFDDRATGVRMSRFPGRIIVFCGLLLGCARLRTSTPPPGEIAGETVAESTGPSNAEEVVPLPPVDATPDELPPPALIEASTPMIAAPKEFCWRDLPFSGSYQVGWLTGDPFSRSISDIPNGPILAKRYGWDFSDHWGVEARLADAWLMESRRFNAAAIETESILFGDLSVLFYPLGNAKFRPYMIVGGGVADFKFLDAQGEKTQRGFADVPFGVGVKYPLKDWLILRAELLDSTRVGGDDLPTMNNVSVTGGAEIRFGDLRKHFMPWRKKTATASPPSP